MGSTDSRLSCLCAAGTVPVLRGQASTRVLGRFDPLPSYGNFHQVSSPLSQSLAAPCIHHPLKGNEQLEASRKPADPLAFTGPCALSFQHAHHQEPPSRRAKGGSVEMQVSCSSCISHFCFPFLLLCCSMQEPLKLHIPIQPGKLPFTGMLQLVSTGSKAQQVMSPGSAANNFCRQMGFARMVPRVLPLSSFP